MSTSRGAETGPRQPAEDSPPATAPRLESAGFGAWQWSVASGEVALSPATAGMHGVSADAFDGTFTAFCDLIHPDDRDRTVAAFFQAFATGTDQFVEYRTSRPDGIPRWVFTWVSLAREGSGGPTGLVGVCLGTEAENHTDHLFRRAQDQLSVVLDGVSDGITVQAGSGDVVYGNAAALRILGVSSIVDLQTMPVGERRERFESTDETGVKIPGDEYPTARALRGERPGEQLMNYQPLDGSERRWVALNSTPVTDDDGRVRFIVNRLRDMTEERRQQEQLRESEARYRLLFEGNPIPMWVFDMHTLKFLAVNDAAVHQYGWSRDEFLGLTLLDIRPPEEQAAILDKLAYVSSAPGGLDRAGIWRHQRRDGSIFDAEVTTHAIVFDGRPARFSLAINVTERTRHERRLERLTSLTAALSAALEPRAVAKVIGQYAISAGADMAAVAALVDDDRSVSILHRTGYPDDVPDYSEPEPVEAPTLLGHVIRTGRPIIAPTWNEIGRLYPELVNGRYFPGETLAGAGLVLPLLVDERPIGALKMSFVEPRPFPQTLLDELRTIAHLCAQALQRSQLFEAEQQARARAEIGERVARREAARTAIMADLSRTLAEAGLDYGSVLDAVARTTAHHSGDACAISIFGASGAESIADTIFHDDPEIRATLQEMFAGDWRAGIDLTVSQISASGEAVLLPVVTEEAPAGFRPEAWPRSMIILPFRAHGRISGALGLIRVVPDRPYTEEDLAFYQELGDRAALALDNARLYHETQEAVRARDEFLSAAAHELRTPVTTVKGYAQMLLRAQVRANLSSDRAAQFLKAIDESTDRLRVLTDDLLDVSRLRLGHLPLRLQSLDLVEMVGNIVERYQMQFDGAHNVSLVVDTPTAEVQVDPDRIEQVISNLLENAAKYSPGGGDIVTAIALVDDGVEVSVRDSGIGLPPDTAERIFEPFSRGENAVRDNLPGLGLGLYICDNIVRRHGGRIRAESAGEGRGSTFHLWLPTGVAKSASMTAD